MSCLLFSYGTLRLDQVQLDVFGRKLKGFPDRLSGYKLAQVVISDERVLKSSKMKFHPIAIKSENSNDFIDGIVFELTLPELEKADNYEVSDYKRINATLESGRLAWVYVAVKK